jgi:predicted RNA methylase
MRIPASQRIEERRQLEQARLDVLKSPAERNRWGQFATPPELALSLARYAQGLTGRRPARFLDPAIGTGSFFSAALQVFGGERLSAATGVELDPLFADTAASLWEGHGLKVIKGDFTCQSAPKQLFDLVLTNPPYVRHHHLTVQDKSRLRAALGRSLGLKISGLAGLYCYFLLLCHDWMEEDGLAIWLIPSQFMSVSYGATLRRYLTERVTLLHIHRFCPTDLQFADALVSSAVVVFRKAVPDPGHTARFSLAGPIDHPEKSARVSLEALRRSAKWTRFPGAATAAQRGEATLGDLFAIRRGLATGSNRFFILTEQELEAREIPRELTRPILPGPRHLSTDVVDALPDGAPAVSPRLRLIDCSEPEERIKERWPALHAYLEHGKQQRIHQAYLTSRRVPWYSQEPRLPAPFLCTYMGRSRNGKQPLRFLWNRSRATAHNVYLMLYPRGALRSVLERQPALQANVFEALQRITSAQLIREGRVYGGGLHKLEPRELAHIPARSVLEALKAHVHLPEQLAMFT